MHSDAADVGFESTLGPDVQVGTPGKWYCSEVWTDEERMNNITIRELRTVHLSLIRSFKLYLRDRSVRHLLIY